MEEFNRTASVVATNIQKLVQNVSSMQRMLVHVETQVLVFSSSSPNDILSKRARGWDLSWDSCSTTLASWRRTPQGSSSSLQTHRLNQYCHWTSKPSAEAARICFTSRCLSNAVPMICLRWLTVEHGFKGRDCKMNSQRWNQYLIIFLLFLLWISRTWFAGSE